MTVQKHIMFRLQGLRHLWSVNIIFHKV